MSSLGEHTWQGGGDKKGEGGVRVCVALCVCALLNDFLNKSQTIEHEILRGGASEKSKLFLLLS
jgi:hypothetical protein